VRFRVAAQEKMMRTAMVSQVAKRELVIGKPNMLPIFSAASDICNISLYQSKLITTNSNVCLKEIVISSDSKDHE